MQEMWAWPWRNQEQGWASCPHGHNWMYNPEQGALSGAVCSDTQTHCGLGSEAEGDVGEGCF